MRPDVGYNGLLNRRHSSRPALPPEKECGFLEAVREFARLQGWLEYHTYNSRRSTKGFPDLCLVRERIVFAECKAEDGRLTPAQQEWKVAIIRAGGEHHVWRPSDWKQIQQALERPRRAYVSGTDTR